MIAVALGLAVAPQGALAVTKDEVCQRYAEVRDHPKAPFDFLILSSSHGIVKTVTIGFPERFRATLSGHNVTDRITDRQPLTCNGEKAGEILTFNLTSIRTNAGYFQIESGPRRAYKPLSTR